MDREPTGQADQQADRWDDDNPTIVEQLDEALARYYRFLRENGDQPIEARARLRRSAELTISGLKD